MGDAENNNRRKHSRVGFETKIKIELFTEGNVVELSGSSKNLSLKGIFVDTGTRFEAGTKCEVRLFLTGGIDEIELLITGVVARVTGQGVGIEFESMDVDTYSHLKNIVYYNSVDD